MKTTVLLLTAVLFNLSVTAQTVPELIFRNPVLENGTAGQNGAKYRFSNVTTQGSTVLDAIVEIKGRSQNDVVITSIDSTSIGWDKAFQPILGIRNVGANREWWMEFRMEFVVAGTNQKMKIDIFYVTGLDIDGDNANLNEWAEMKKAKQATVSQSSSLSTSLLSTVLDILDSDNDGNDYRINGPRSNYANIDTLATAVMATYKYVKKDRIEFKIGGKTNSNGGSAGDAGVRMNSLWFKQFGLAPALTTLPVDFISFTALLMNNTNKVALKWTTASEKNVSHFVVERSTDGKQYSEAGIVFASNNTSDNSLYTYTDNNATAYGNVLYYRVRSVDADGTLKYTPTRIIRSDKQTENTVAILTYPNPVTSELRVTIPNNWQDKKVVYEIVNAGGVAAQKTAMANSSQTESLDISKLASGIYMVKVSCGAETATQKIIKN
jgi:Secretion system C-terminal sorting domain